MNKSLEKIVSLCVSDGVPVMAVIHGVAMIIADSGDYDDYVGLPDDIRHELDQLIALFREDGEVISIGSNGVMNHTETFKKISEILRARGL